MSQTEVFEKAVSILREGRAVALVTVVETIGSTPGKCGYKMLVDSGSEVCGTVGGGLLEAEMIREGRQMLAQPQARTFRFDLGQTSDDEKGICGGVVEFLIETFDAKALPLFEGICTTARSSHAVLVSVVSADGLPRKILLKDATAIDAALQELSPEIIRAIKETASAGQGTTRVKAADMDVFVESVARAPVVMLFGAGHVSAHIARIARGVHFDVVVCDDRSEYANAERFPDASCIIVEDFAGVFDTLAIDADCYIVIVTRGHAWDELVLEKAIGTEARYIGMIGSRRKTTTILEKLRQKGIGAEALDKVYSPIGISIGSVTAEEIALSIVCELVKIRRLGDEADIGHLMQSRSSAQGEGRP
jgi:xanthine dehydrogenase accessory factor